MYWVAFGEPLGSINRIISTEFLSVISVRRIKRDAVLARHAHWNRVTYYPPSNVECLREAIEVLGRQQVKER